jgi:BASS family bile acid:Na+ symporter
VGWSQQLSKNSSQKFIKNGDRVKLNAAAVAEAAEPPAPISGFQKFSDIFSNLFPVWTLAVAVLGIMKPNVLGGIPTQYFTGLLAALMLSMGITLSLDDFKRVMQRPGVVGLGFLMCYGLMPAMAIGLSKLIGLSPAMTAGMVLVGSINGGQASNLCTYIARGDVALSVLLTTVTTTGAIFMTPLLCKVLLGATVPVDALGVAISTIQVVLAPIVTGMFMNAKFPKMVKKIEPFSPIIGISSTSILVGSAVAQCASPILAAGWSLQLACALLHILGGVLAYLLCKPMGYDEKTCRTFAIETSMKSSAFGFLLAKLHFADFLVRVPSAVSVVWMALVGSSLAVVMRALPSKD